MKIDPRKFDYCIDYPMPTKEQVEHTKQIGELQHLIDGNWHQQLAIMSKGYSKRTDEDNVYLAVLSKEEMQLKADMRKLMWGILQ